MSLFQRHKTNSVRVVVDNHSVQQQVFETEYNATPPPTTYIDENEQDEIISNFRTNIIQFNNHVNYMFRMVCFGLILGTVLIELIFIWKTNRIDSLQKNNTTTTRNYNDDWQTLKVQLIRWFHIIISISAYYLMSEVFVLSAPPVSMMDKNFASTTSSTTSNNRPSSKSNIRSYDNPQSNRFFQWCIRHHGYIILVTFVMSLFCGTSVLVMLDHHDSPIHDYYYYYSLGMVLCNILMFLLYHYLLYDQSETNQSIQELYDSRYKYKSL